MIIHNNFNKDFTILVATNFVLTLCIIFKLKLLFYILLFVWSLYIIVFPHFGIWLIIWVYPLEGYYIFFPKMLTFTKLLGIILFISIAIRISLYRRKIELTHSDVVILAFLLWIVLTSLPLILSINLDSISKPKIWLKLLSLNNMIIFYFIVANFELKPLSNYVHKVVLFSLINSIILFLYLYIKNPLLLNNLNQRFSLANWDPNEFAIITISYFFFSSYYLLKRISIIRLNLFVIIFLAVTWMTFISKSRTGIIALIVAYLFFFLLSLKYESKEKTFVLFFLIVVSIFVISIIYNDLIRNVISERFIKARESYAGITSYRSIIWSVALKKVIPEHFLFGVGWGLEKFYIGEYFFHNFVAHNTFLSIIISGGIIGLLLFISFLIMQFLYAYTQLGGTHPLKNLQLSIMLSLIIIIISFFSLTYWDNKFFWLLLGLNDNIYKNRFVTIKKLRNKKIVLEMKEINKSPYRI